MHLTVDDRDGLGAVGVVVAGAGFLIGEEHGAIHTLSRTSEGTGAEAGEGRTSGGRSAGDEGILIEERSVGDVARGHGDDAASVVEDIAGDERTFEGGGTEDGGGELAAIGLVGDEEDVFLGNGVFVEAHGIGDAGQGELIGGASTGELDVVANSDDGAEVVIAGDGGDEVGGLGGDEAGSERGGGGEAGRGEGEKRFTHGHGSEGRIRLVGRV